jgi:hypothetical protein
MTQYNKEVPFPAPFIPGEVGPRGADPFANLVRRLTPGAGRQAISGGGGGGGGGGLTIEQVRALIAAMVPRHPWQIVIDNHYDYTDPDAPVPVSPTATIFGGSLIYNAFNLSTTFTVTNIGTTFIPVNGGYLYLAGAVNSGFTITSITLTNTTSLPADKIHFVGLLQDTFYVGVGRFIQLVDGSFVAEQWVHNHLTVHTICVVDALQSKQAKYLL